MIALRWTIGIALSYGGRAGEAALAQAQLQRSSELAVQQAVSRHAAWALLRAGAAPGNDCAHEI